jgi:hypothetical protein
MMFFRIFQHLLPNARAWRITVDKNLRRFFEGLSGVGVDAKVFFDQLWLDIFPSTTRVLTEWEDQWGLSSTGLSDQDRRSRLEAAWRALGGQDPKYLQDTLRANGFDVYIHEWWVPESRPVIGNKTCATPRNPFSVLRNDNIDSGLTITCGNPISTCGNPDARCGSSSEPIGYPLVNKIRRTTGKLHVTCGNPAITCGSPSATAGGFQLYHDVPMRYFIPIDSSKWSYFLYIGGQNFGEPAFVNTQRKNEFEALCLKICPAQQWLGIIVEYN